MEGRAPPKRWHLWYGRVTHLRGPGSCSLSSLPRAQTSVSPHMAPVHSALPLPEPRMSGCEQNFVCWPFRRAPVSLKDFYLSLADRIPTDFTARCYVGASCWLWCSGLGNPVWGWNPPTPQREPLQLRYPSGSQLPPVEWGQPSLHPCSSYQSWCSFFQKSLIIRILLS